MTQMNKDAYARIIKQDIEWLENNSEPSLEKEHIKTVLEDSIERFYPDTITLEGILSGRQSTDGRFISREDIDRFYTTQRCYVLKEDIDARFRKLNGQTILDKYTLTDKQIEWIKDSLSEHNPQTEFFEDLIYGIPSQNCGGFVITVWEGRNDIVGINLGEYTDGLFYYSPVRKGKFETPEVLKREIIGIIPFKNKEH